MLRTRVMNPVEHWGPQWNHLSNSLESRCANLYWYTEPKCHKNYLIHLADMVLHGTNQIKSTQGFVSVIITKTQCSTLASSYAASHLSKETPQKTARYVVHFIQAHSG